MLKNVPEINRRQQTQRNEDNCVKVMEQWEVNFLQHHLNKYVVFKIRIKCHHRSTEYVPPPPGFVLDAAQTHPDMRRASWALTQTDSKDTRMRAFINTHTGELLVLRKDQAAEKEKREREALKPVCDESFKDRAR